MKSKELGAYREKMGRLLGENDPAFFAQFGALDAAVLGEGAISRKHKELMAMAIGITTMCRECAWFHVEGAVSAGASKQELIEAVQMAVLCGGATVMPTARFAYEIMDELGVL